MKMTLHHYLPATYLASFSNDNTLPRRDRRIAVGDKRLNRIFTASAAKLGAIKNFYSLTAQSDNPEFIETAWQEYEANLAEAVELLIAGEIDARAWAGVLVPFVAGMLVRGPDFNDRFEARLGPIARSVGPDNTNRARSFELQRLLGPIVAAEWIVMRARGTGSIITNDIGFEPFRDSRGQVGFAIPLGHRHAIGVFPRRRGAIVGVKNGEWRPLIKYVWLRPENHRGLNIALARSARRFIFGADQEVVGRYLVGQDLPSYPVPEPREIGFISGRLAAVHEFTWHRLCGALVRSPDDEDAWNFELDWKAVASIWKPPVVMIPTNLPEFPPALRREGNMICVDFYDVEDFASQR